MLRLTIIFAACLVVSTQAAAQDLGSAGEEDRVEDIIVVARRSQTPIWEVSRDGRSLILVGNIRGLPRSVEWSPAGLEAATARADRVLYPPDAAISPADIFRMLWRSRTISRLPGETTSADYLDGALQARLERVMADQDEAWHRKSFFMLGFDLMQSKAGYGRGGDDAEDVVRRAARRQRIAGEEIGSIRGDEVIDNLIRLPPSAYEPCIAAAVTAAEAGRDSFVERAEDWRGLRVGEVITNPLDQALGQCWPWGDPELGPRLREQWLSALSASLELPGVTLAVAPLRLLAEPDGVLDRLEAQGYEVRGPDWRTR